jgi:hypothetical protein
LTGELSKDEKEVKANFLRQYLMIVFFILTEIGRLIEEQLSKTNNP